jgi:hypothetical protein
LQAALGEVAAAEAADREHESRQLAAGTAQLFAAASYHSQTPVASVGLESAQRAWQQCLDTATQIQAELEAAVERCEHQIREASGMRFHKNPSGLGAVASGVSDFVKDHAAGLEKLSGALKMVSAITGMVSFIPGIGEITLAVSLPVSWRWSSTRPPWRPPANGIWLPWPWTASHCFPPSAKSPAKLSTSPTQYKNPEQRPR